MEFSEIILELVGGQDPMCDRGELALQMGVSRQTITDYINGTQPRWDAVVRLSHYLIREYQYYTLAFQTLLVCNGGRSDGNVDDDLLELYAHGSRLREAHKSDKSKYQSHLGAIESKVEDLKAEGNW